MNTLSDSQKTNIITLIREGRLSSEDIARQCGVSSRTVSAVKAHLTMGRYSEPPETEEVLNAVETTFGLERDLQVALRSNIEQLEPGLAIIDGGHEYATEAGRIDITARDSQGGLVAIELKAGTAQPDSIAQILSYISTLSSDGDKPVRGILVAGDFSSRVVYASRAVPNLALKRYRFQFSFETVG